MRTLKNAFLFFPIYLSLKVTKFNKSKCDFDGDEVPPSGDGNSKIIISQYYRESNTFTKCYQSGLVKVTIYKSHGMIFKVEERVD